MNSNTNEEIEEEIIHQNESTAAPILPSLKEHLIQIPSLHETQSKRRFSDFKNFSFHACKEWLSHPMNIALLLWLLCILAFGTMLALLMLGLLNDMEEVRNRWIEIDNQILNALFTLMSIYKHPVLFHHLFVLCRCRTEDITELRKIYCRNDAHPPNEWAHMMVVIVLLHIACFSQYAQCCVNWGFTSHTRPEVLQHLFIALGITASVCAGLYSIYSPLGRRYESDDSDEESQSLMNGNAMHDPEWIGGLFDCFDDVQVAYLSCCCTCCVFGWNMERLGFGNMYVHTVTFLLLCLAPFWVFSISALKIHDYVIGDALGISGVVLCVFGLVYGGFWRIQMRKRFKLPENSFCCGSASLTDYLQWAFCWSCTLAQEVRTGKLFEKPREEDEERQPLLNEGGLRSAFLFSFGDNAGNPDAEVVEVPRKSLGFGDERDEAVHSSKNVDEVMTPPVLPLMKVEDEGLDATSLFIRDGLDEPILPLVKVKDGVNL